MRILLVNNLHHQSGGTETYYFNLAKLLQKKGHEVAFFTTESKHNITSPNPIFKVPFPELHNINFYNWLKIFANGLYSLKSQKEFSKAIKVFKPDIVHVQNIYMAISPSILVEAKKKDIPVVMTIHDYNLLTPNNTFFHNGSVCWIPINGNYFKTLIHKCVRGSLFGTFIVNTILQIHKYTKIYQKNIDFYIFPSNFAQKMFKDFDNLKIKSDVVHNFAFAKKKHNNRDKGYVLYFGQLSEHKGLDLLIDAAFLLPQVKFTIAGDGDMQSLIKNKILSMRLNNTTLTGKISQRNITNLIRKSLFVVTPSLWPENAPYSIIESLREARPVIASNTGGIPEMVNKSTGILFESKNTKKLTEAIQTLWSDDKTRQAMSKAAFEHFANHYSEEVHYNKLIKIYKKLISNENK